MVLRQGGIPVPMVSGVLLHPPRSPQAAKHSGMSAASAPSAAADNSNARGVDQTLGGAPPTGLGCCLVIFRIQSHRVDELASEETADGRLVHDAEESDGLAPPSPRGAGWRRICASTSIGLPLPRRDRDPSRSFCTRREPDRGPGVRARSHVRGGDRLVDGAATLRFSTGGFRRGSA